MKAFLQLMREKYGGVKSYLESVIGLSSDEILIIQKNLLYINEM